jgi:hypothetical protein
MKKFLTILKKYWIFALLAVLAITTAFVVDAIYAPREIKQWKFTKDGKGQYDKYCPFLGGYPIHYKVEKKMPRHYLGPIAEAEYEVNTEIGAELQMGEVWIPVSKHTTSNNIIVHIKVAPPEWYGFKKLCELVKLGDKVSESSAPAYAEFIPKFKDGNLLSATIYLCTKKIDHAMTLMNTPIVKYLQTRLKRKGVVKHEMIHGILGENHPRHSSDISAASPELTTVSDHVLLIIKTHVLPVCRKYGRITQFKSTGKYKRVNDKLRYKYDTKLIKSK